MFTSIPDAGKIILITNETSATVLTLCITVSLCLLCPARLLCTRDNNTIPPDHWLAGGVYSVAPTVSHCGYNVPLAMVVKPKHAAQEK
jgi:hypothetical protein